MTVDAFKRKKLKFMRFLMELDFTSLQVVEAFLVGNNSRVCGNEKVGNEIKQRWC
jgi:hypothetical protein